MNESHYVYGSNISPFVAPKLWSGKKSGWFQPEVAEMDGLIVTAETAPIFTRIVCVFCK